PAAVGEHVGGQLAHFFPPGTLEWVLREGETILGESRESLCTQEPGRRLHAATIDDCGTAVASATCRCIALAAAVGSGSAPLRRGGEASCRGRRTERVRAGWSSSACGRCSFFSTLSTTACRASQPTSRPNGPRYCGARQR